MPEENSLTMDLQISSQDLEPGLASFKAAIAKMPFTTTSITYEDGTLHVEATFSDDGDGLEDLVFAAIDEAFPALKEEVIEHEDPILGCLRYRENPSVFEGQLHLGTRENVHLLIHSPPGPPPTNVLARAKDIVHRWPEWADVLAARIVVELLPQYNDGWQLRDEKANALALSAEEFLNRLAVDCVTIEEDLKVRISYYTDGMFDYLQIQVWISEDDEIGGVKLY